MKKSTSLKANRELLQSYDLLQGKLAAPMLVTKQSLGLAYTRSFRSDTEAKQFAS